MGRAYFSVRYVVRVYEMVIFIMKFFFGFSIFVGSEGDIEVKLYFFFDVVGRFLGYC